MKIILRIWDDFVGGIIGIVGIAIFAVFLPKKHSDLRWEIVTNVVLIFVVIVSVFLLPHKIIEILRDA